MEKWFFEIGTDLKDKEGNALSLNDILKDDEGNVYILVNFGDNYKYDLKFVLDLDLNSSTKDLIMDATKEAAGKLKKVENSSKIRKTRWQNDSEFVGFCNMWRRK